MSTDATPAGQEAECAHKTKGSDQFKTCAHAARRTGCSINGSYGFSVCAPQPRRAARTSVWRIVDRGSVECAEGAVDPATSGCASTFAFAVNAAAGQRVVVAKQVFFGWCDAAPRPSTCACTSTSCSCGARWTRAARRTSRHARLRTSRRCSARSQPGRVSGSCIWSVDGIWGRWPGTLAAKDGSTFAGKQTVDFYVRRGKAVDARRRSLASATSARCRAWTAPATRCVPCPRTNEVGNSKGDDYPGAITVAFRSPAASLGRHVANASTAGSSCPPSNVHGCYQLTYTVSRVR